MAPSTVEQLESAEKIIYGDKQINVSSNGKNVYVISDLHLAAGCNSDSNYDGTENFFADGAFARFINHVINQSAGTPSLLVINGDFIDFLRIVNIPAKGPDMDIWQQVLQDVGLSKTIAELNESITKKEEEYGLKTDHYKSVWKLLVCAKGHKKIFESLALWLAQGNDLVVVKGNHDLEWYWRPVRDYLRVLLAKRIESGNNITMTSALNEIVIPQLTFIDDKLIIDNKIYVEHGHCYENFTVVDGNAVLEKTTELNLPVGSFFNRYLINKIELAYPHIDDVRPRQKILPLLLQERFPLAVKLLFNYVPFAFRIIPKKQYKYAFRYLFQFLLIIALPLVITIIIIYKDLAQIRSITSSSLFRTVFNTIKNLAFLSLSYFLGRLMSMLQLSAPMSLFKNASDVFENMSTIQFVTFGHTHDPEQRNYKNSDRRYFNTGTWMPVFATDAGEVRGDKIYSFLYLPYNNLNGETPCLMRWNDDALRTEELILIDRK